MGASESRSNNGNCAQLEDGDILCIQRSLEEAEVERYAYPT